MKFLSRGFAFLATLIAFSPLLPAAEQKAAPESPKKVIELWPEGIPDAKTGLPPERVDNGRVYSVNTPTLTVFAPDKPRPGGTAVIICPGGGYDHLSAENEGAAVARWLNTLGATGFVLRYRLTEYGHPAPLRDVLRALRLVRSRATEFGINPTRIGVLGASAGGHLAACAGTLFDTPEGKTGAALDKVSARPDFVVLLYAVVSMKEPNVHMGSRRALLGANPSPELLDRLSPELQVTKDTSPMFIVHTEEDRSVTDFNSIALYQALHAARVPVEMHLYEKGPHGFGMRKDLGQTSEWPKRCEEWMRAHGWLPEFDG
ncbi:MAG TPA: alpha/beta hydrolase [Opitutaceae bacterium]|nr:alpha/beta hydrolase [Opitutaceae bacterium]